ncbi:MAG TPA: hypothetical protein VLF68_05095, partial [Candidatus Saccharimonadales bacterium]|nr:hypothetical protein [Candidatus Saccharimonadales bacterium]
MKKFLPILLILILGLQFFFAVKPVFAQTPSSSGTTTTTDANGNVPNVPCPPNGWQQDSEVTFIGKVGKRSEDFLDWTLQNYHWVDLAAGAANPVQDFWSRIRNIVYVFFPFIILISAFILIITRGKSVTLSRFAIRFLIVAFLVTFSFAIIQLFYQFFDVIQEFFLKSIKGGGLIGTKNLLYVGFNYDFTGYRCVGIAYDESAFISLLLVKLTAITYYVMTGVLLLRKIILWFFIIVSPIFPLLLLYAPVRNTGKIWIGEFFRWLLYAPLFAIFLAGLVNLWSDDKVGIPLHFGPKPMEYQTAVNILLGGPKETVSLANSVNTPDTFAKYVVALLMLWVVIILPFLLLQIFLDYFHAFSFSESPVIKQMLAAGGGLIGKNPSPPSPAPVNPQQPTGTGMARLLPFGNKIAIPTT